MAKGKKRQLDGWWDYFEGFKNEVRAEEASVVDNIVIMIGKEETRHNKEWKIESELVLITYPLWKQLGEVSVDFLTRLFHRMWVNYKKWSKSVLVPIFKNKGIKLMSHTMKVRERVVEAINLEQEYFCATMRFNAKK